MKVNSYKTGVAAITLIAAAAQIYAVPPLNKGRNAPAPAPYVSAEEEIGGRTPEPRIPTPPKPPRIEERNVVIQRPGAQERKKVAWLGVASEESTEPLSAQLKLPPGVGLIVNYVAPESPAAAAGIQKNDVLVGFNEQQLVHPAQLRKLVHVRKPGDTVKLELIRGGEKLEKEIALAETSNSDFMFLGEEFRDFGRRLGAIPFRELAIDQANALREHFKDLKIDKERIEEEVKRSVVEAKRALEEAKLHALNQKEVLDPAAEAVAELERSKGRSSSVIIRSTKEKNTRSVVKADDNGTVVIVANPKPRLTAHNNEGKLIFDGPIDTQDQRDKVPRDLWQRVEPVLDELDIKPQPEKEAEQ